MDEQSSADVTAYSPGTSVLVCASDRSTGREWLRAGLAEVDEGAAVLVVATEDANEAVEALRTRDVDPGAMGVVDASSAGPTLSGVAEASAVDGPGSLSALGIAISDVLDRLAHRFDRVYVGFDTASDIVAAAPLPATFRFFHVLCGRMRTGGAVLVATIDRRGHDEEVLRTIAELFDETVDVE